MIPPPADAYRDRMNTEYDVIVVGARVAGSPTAMLLARRGYRVLLVDRARFPSDTMSTHLIHPPGMAALARWGLADRVVATGCPPVHTYRIDVGPVALVGTPRGLPEAPMAYGPRRDVLDALLVDAARTAGAEVREGFSVEAPLVEDGAVRGVRGHGPDRRTTEIRARVVVGADGSNSVVARGVGAPRYREVPPRNTIYYGHWSGLPTDGEFQLYARDRMAYATVPTNAGLTCVAVIWPPDRFDAVRRDLEASYLAALRGEPSLADRIAGATLETRLTGTRMHNFYRLPYGPGWALAGDAGYHKDAATAQGITDAFRDAEALAEALDAALSGRRPYAEALRDHHETRDRVTLPMYQFTCDFASVEPPGPEDEQLIGLVYGNPDATEDFVSMIAGTMPVPEFFDETNLAEYAGVTS